MATFRKNGDRWVAEVCVNGIRKSKTKDTKAEAKSWAAQAEIDFAELVDGFNTTITFNDVFIRYANEVSEKKKGAQWEIVRLKMFARFAIAGVRLVDLRRENFDQYIDDRLVTVQASSVNRELNLMSHCLTQARRWRLMDHNPMTDLKRPKNPPHRDRRIFDKEIEALLVVLRYSEQSEVRQQQQRVAVAFLFAIETAMRLGEICSLVADNVDLEARTAFLPDTKNGTSRTVPLSREAVRLLNRLRPWPERGAILGVSSKTVTTLFARAVGLAGIDDLVFHDSRHEGTTRLAGKLPNVLDLARVTGHKDIKQLMTYYNKTAAELAMQLD
ncbi:site-specific integrase [Cellvibrio sp. KY-GH-1]|uniref:tyrosine-type recombinase/integrase n=1 Tax=Cellvibrio sp. KY-GH-1 TaxID=2303332 RepID=UPI0012458A98|nr:site-specific integrase [Cellvibrio sp. KY-GH-1]QEY15506.1 site-specific integrase [Cellvibrio sp. KY-GH-1]